MPSFAYKAIDEKGRLAQNTAEADSVEQLTDLLQQRGLFLMESRLLAAPTRTAAPQAAPVLAPRVKPKRIPLERLGVFTHEFSVMLRTAIPIEEALHVLGRQELHPNLRGVIEDVHRRVQRGESLSESFANFPEVFDEVYLSLLRAGESSGSISDMLQRLSDYLEFRRQLRSKLRSAVLYPSFILITGFGVAGFLTIYVLPVFAEIFRQMQVALPWSTRALLTLSGAVRSGAWIFGPLMFALIAAIAWVYRRPRVRAWLEPMEIRLPVIGVLVRNVILARSLRTLSALVAAGVPILNALQLARDSAANSVIGGALASVAKSASEGRGLATALERHPVFPLGAARMIGNAERTGTLPEVLEKIAVYYEQETDNAIRNVFTVLEPLFVVLIGVAVGAVAVSILWPLFSLDPSAGL